MENSVVSGRRAPLVAGALSVAAGALILLVWVTGLDGVTDVGADWPKMSPGTALLSVVSGIGLALTGLGRGLLSMALGALVVLFAGYRAAAHLTGTATGLDHLWVGRPDVGTVSPLTAASFLLIGSALMLPRLTGGFVGSGAQVLFQALTWTSVLLSGAGLYRYLFGGAPLSVLAEMSVPTCVVVLALGLGTAWSRPDLGLVRLLLSDGLDGWLCRRLLPAALLVPTAAGLLALNGLRSDWYAAPAAMSLLVLANVVLLTSVISGTAATLGLVDRRRQAAEQARWQSAAWLKAISDHAPVGIGLKDLDGRYLMVNSRLADFLGAPVEQVVGRTDIELLPEQAAELIRERDQQAIEAGTAVTQDVLAPRDDHTFISARTPLRAETGEIYALCEITTDITERVRAEQQVRAGQERYRQLSAELEVRVRERTAELETANSELNFANTELESFAYSVSHDLKAPLRSINGFATLLTEAGKGRLTEEDRHYLERMVTSSREMTALIEALLELSRTGRHQLKRQSVEMTPLLRELLDPLAEGEREKPVTVTVAEMPAALVDPVLVRQVWANLVGNAIKYSAENPSPVVEIGYLPEDEAPVYFVRDNGVGFDMRYADKLFGVFQRLHKASEFEGTGVGLSIVDRIVRRHGGRIWAESEPGKGATFFFTLPAPGRGDVEPPPQLGVGRQVERIESRRRPSLQTAS